MAGLDFFSLVCACLCRQSLLHGRGSQRLGPGRSCPLAPVLQAHQGQGGVQGSGAGTAQALLLCFDAVSQHRQLSHPAPLLAAFLL